MPSMYEIYDGHADRYDDLVDCEDYAGNLRRYLRDAIPWAGAAVAEAGIGTGRVTRIYVDLAASVIGFDRSAHMLDRARSNLDQWHDRVRLTVADHLSLPLRPQSVDVFVEGWAFGHAVVDAGERAENVIDRLVAAALSSVRPGGQLVLIETLGTNVAEPTPPVGALSVFYERLEEVHGFTRTTVPTDYRFTSRDEAIRRCGFFFGRDMAQALAGAVPTPENSGFVVPEFTGVWLKSK